ncbi:unnamed protein product, partial [Ectocarpus fasciculatus]
MSLLAENYLASVEAQAGFTICLLSLVKALISATAADEIAIRQSASVTFKNVIKRRWSPEEDSGLDPIPQSDREAIKNHLVALMCTTPPDVQRQLAEAISLVAKADFPQQWTSLLPQLVEKLQENNLHVTNGVLLTANSIFKRFRYSYESDALLIELDYCLKGFQEPLLKIFVHLGTMVQAAEHDQPQMLVLLETLRLCCRVYFSLNFQDIPEYFEDNIKPWMTEFLKYLSYKNYALGSKNDTDAGPVERLQSAIVDNLVLYVSKYEEQFAEFLQPFTQVIWQLLLEVGPQAKFDILATSAIKFLTAVSGKEVNIGLFNDDILQQIVEKIVVKNLTCTENDVELFDENPTDYIRKDLEGGDVDTRRRGACELVRSLLKFFSTKVSGLCVGFIDALLTSYRSTGDWRQKDAALHLLLSVAVMNTTVTQGAGALNPNVNIMDLFSQHVLTEVSEQNVNDKPIVKADAIKLICLFRSHFPGSFMLSIMPNLIRFLLSEHVVVQTYAAICIEKFLLVKDIQPAAPGAIPQPSKGAAPMRIVKSDILPYQNDLFNGLFNVLDNTELPENDYVMKCIMRVLSIIGSDIAPVSDLVMRKLTVSLERVCKNPMNPHFNHYLFECLALLVRSCCSSGDTAAITKMEGLVFPPFQSVLALDVEEFIPYVFQILAQLLSCRPENGGLSEAYRALFVPLLAPVLWERKGNVPALTDLFKAYLSRGSGEIVSGNHVTPVLGIFQKLLSAKSTEVMAFKLLCSIFTYIPLGSLDQYLSVLFQLLFQRLQENKTPRYCKLVLHALCSFVLVNGGQALLERLEKMQQGLLANLIAQVWAPNADFIAAADILEVNQMIVGGSRLLCESNISRDQNTFMVLLKCILKLLGQHGSTDSATEGLLESLLEDEIAESREFDSKYSRLAFSQIPDASSPPEVKQSHSYFAVLLSNLCRASPGVYA